MDQGGGYGLFNNLTMTNAVANPLTFQNPLKADGMTVGGSVITITLSGWWLFTGVMSNAGPNTLATVRSFVSLHINNGFPAPQGATTQTFRSSLGPSENYVEVTGLALMPSGTTVSFDIYHNSGNTAAGAGGNWWAKWLGDTSA